MSILKADILTFTNAKLALEDAVTDILDEINITLKNIAKAAKWPALYRANESDDRETLASGDSSTALPTNCRILDFIIINDGTNDGRPLKDLAFEKWLKKREDETSASYDEPTKFARRGNSIFWDPIPDGAYTAKYYFWRHHPTVVADTDDILFGDEFETVVKYGVTAEVAKTHKRIQSGEIDLWESRYNFEIAKMIPEEDLVETLIDYQD